MCPAFLVLYLTTQVNIRCSSSVVVLNVFARYILLPFNIVITNSTVYQLTACYGTLYVYCRRYSSVTCKGVHVLISGALFTIDVMSGSHTHSLPPVASNYRILK
jgi:hypothetical protein